MNKIYENPFRVLGVLPSDDRAKLNTLAREAFQANDQSALDALNHLLNPLDRLEAEMNWFPGMDADRIQAVFAFAQSETAQPCPELPGAGLATCNAGRILLRKWKAHDMDSTMALCKSYAALDAGLNARGVMNELNADRLRGGHQPIEDINDVAARLQSLRTDMLAEILQRVKEAEGNFNRDALALRWAQACAAGEPLLRDLLDAYIRENEDRLKQETRAVLDCIAEIKASNSVGHCQTQVMKLCRALDTWNTATSPERELLRQQGKLTQDHADVVNGSFQALNHVIERFRLARESLDLMRAMKRAFWSLPDVVKNLDESIHKLQSMLH